MMKEIKLTIPNEWKDITIEVYQEYLKIQESEKDEKEKVIESVSVLCNVDKKIITKMDYIDLIDIIKILKHLTNQEPKQSELRKKFFLNNEEYGFIPDLSRLTTGEYIDLETYTKNPIENLHIIMSIIFRKITNTMGDRYAIEDYNPDEFKEELFKKCPMDIALNSLGFFLTLGEKLARISGNYLQKQMTNV